MKKWSVEALSLAGVGFVLLVVGGVAAMGWNNLTLSQASSNRVERTYEAFIWLGQLRADLLQAEMAQHGYRRRGDAAALRARDDALAHLERRLAAAAHLADDQRGRRARLDALRYVTHSQVVLGFARPAARESSEEALHRALQLAERSVLAERAILREANSEDSLRNRHALNNFVILLIALAAVMMVILLRIRGLTLARNAAHAMLAQSQRRYRHLAETAHEGVWMLDHQARTTFANLRLAQMFGTDVAAMTGRTACEYFGTPARAALDAILACPAGRASRSYDLRYARSDGLEGWAMVSGRAVSDLDSASCGILLVVTDITERKCTEQALAIAHRDLESRIRLRTAELLRANEQLRAEIAVRRAAEQAQARSEQWLQEIITMMPIPLFLKDADSRVVLMNQACEEQWGIGFAELSGTRGSAWFPPEQMAAFLAADRAVFAGGALHVAEECQWNHALQENRQLRTYKKPVYDERGKPHLLIGVSLDITDSKRAEQALQRSFMQLRQLTAHQEAIKEDERKRIARDIHDDLGQSLMALKIDVTMLHTRAGAAHPRLQTRVGQVLATIDASIRSVRAIINDLHPSTLELGLCAAVEWLIGQFRIRSGVRCTLDVRDEDVGQRLDNRRTAAVFRIMQEALVNVVRHARATEVHLTLTLEAEALCVTVADNGVGMGPDDASKQSAFGLRGMRERVDAFGGELIIDSNAARGTALTILIPLEDEICCIGETIGEKSGEKIQYNRSW